MAACRLIKLGRAFPKNPDNCFSALFDGCFKKVKFLSTPTQTDISANEKAMFSLGNLIVCIFDNKLCKTQPNRRHMAIAFGIFTKLVSME